MPTLLCTVRGCGEALVRGQRRAICPRGHSYDVARSGYLNLLQPQDRRSSTPGDSPTAVAARRRFLDRGFAAPIVDAITESLALNASSAILDAGCGEGHQLAAICRRFGCAGTGVDISAAAIDAAAKRHREIDWIVANADRSLPFADGSFHAVCSITARMNAPEFRRVMSDAGVLLIAVPAADDLVELREAILGDRVLRDRVERTVAGFSSHFTLERHERIAATPHLDHQAIEDVMTTSYRALRHSEKARMDAIRDLDVTLSRDVLVFRA